MAEDIGDFVPAAQALRPPDIAGHSIYSTHLEQVLEHLFVGELLRCLWRAGQRHVEVLRSEVDSGGYDVVIDCNDVLRHIQLKSSHVRARKDHVDINTMIEKKPSGCVIWMMFEPNELRLGPFLWFGEAPGLPIGDLGDRIARHTRGSKSPRPGIRVLKKSRFTKLPSIAAVAEALFGVSDAGNSAPQSPSV